MRHAGCGGAGLRPWRRCSLGAMVAPACSWFAPEEAVFWRSRAELLEAENARLAAQNTTLAGTVAAQLEQLAALKQRVVTLSRMLFGTSSEKSDPGKRGAGDGPAIHDGRLPDMELWRDFTND
jgi:hypothetical protein